MPINERVKQGTNPDIEPSRYDPKIVEYVFSLSPDELYQNHDGSQASVLRAAHLRAQALREAGADPGDAALDFFSRGIKLERMQAELDAQSASFMPPSATLKAHSDTRKAA